MSIVRYLRIPRMVTVVSQYVLQACVEARDVNRKKVSIYCTSVRRCGVSVNMKVTEGCTSVRVDISSSGDN